MFGQAPAPRLQSYLVEHYRPGLSAAELEQAATRVHDAIDELERSGEPVRFRHATIVVADESLLCVVEAASEALVQAAYTRANVTYERISAAVTEPR
jgi:hypothetical protein